MLTVRLRISGKVQGVWFRASAKDKAISLGLSGKVWNERSGEVGILAQGAHNQIMEFVEWCKVGPPLAKVAEVNVENVETKEVFSSFEVARE
jgi:acylphosphatase